jgi:hypothetical protein
LPRDRFDTHEFTVEPQQKLRSNVPSVVPS